MKVEIKFMHLEMTEALENKIYEKSERLMKYYPNLSPSFKWTCSVSNGEHHAELRVICPRHQYLAHAKTNSLYKTFDQVINKLEKQIVKNKEVSKLRKRKEEQKVYLEPEVAWIDHDDEYDQAA